MNRDDDFEFQLRAQQQVLGDSGGTATYVDPTDNTVYEWDEEKRAWFPKITDDFIAAYQAQYGVQEFSDAGNDTTGAVASTGAVAMSTEDKKPAAAAAAAVQPQQKQEDVQEGDSRKRKTDAAPASWFDLDTEHNRWVYVSGLPSTTTVDEFVEIMSKYGVIMEDDNEEKKVKLYTDVNGHFKGDGLCCYLKVESVDLAIQLLHQSTYKDCVITVDRAKFQQKGEYNPALKKKKKKGKKKGTPQEKVLDWRERAPDGPARSKYDKIVIFKSLFDPKEFDEHPELINDIRDDLRDEGAKFGEVKKIIIFDRHPEGVASVAFKDFEGADKCVAGMNKRWYAQRQLLVSLWDGITNYQVEETDEERSQRLKTWEKFLEEQQEQQAAAKKN
ncbi:hypothetical protein EMCRGX_G034921 [Ephydatia muelleri]|eukprot:Em0023g795a